MSLGPWRAALRIARRDALRAKGRSALIVAMIAIPVLGMSAADVTFRSVQLDPDEMVSRELGRADARLQDTGYGLNGRAHGVPEAIRQTPNADEWQPAVARQPSFEESSQPESTEPSDPPAPRDPSTLVPGVTEWLTDRSAYANVTTAHGRTDVPIREFDYAAPLAKGMVLQRKGRAPRAPDEVVVTEDLRRAAGYKVGGQLTEKSTGRTFRIVGTVDLPNQLNDRTVFARPGSVVDAMLAAPNAVMRTPATDRVLVRVPGGMPWSKVLEANKQGIVVKSAEVLKNPPPKSQQQFETPRQWADSRALRLGGIGLGLGLMEMILLAGPAFAVGARRRRRELGLIGVAGGSRRHVGGIVLGGGVVLGAVGALVGTGLGLVVAALMRSWFAERSGKLLGHYDVRPLELLGIGAVGVAVGVVAALIPAYLAAREDIAASLTGRRGVRHGSRVLPIVGVAIAAIGVAIALYGANRADDKVIIAGVVAAELGLVACCPALIGITAKLGRFLPLSPRLALRDAARSRPRSAPAVAAVMAAVAGSVVVAVVWMSQSADERNMYNPNAQENHVIVGFPGLHPMGITGEQTGMTKAQAADARRTLERILPEAKGGPIGMLKGTCKEPNRCVDYRAEKLPEFQCPQGDQPADFERWRNDPRCFGSSGRGGFFMSAVGDADTLRRLTGADDPRAADVLARGGIVLFEEGYVAPDGKATVKAGESVRLTGPVQRPPAPGQEAEQRDVVTRLPAVSVRAPFGLPGIFASPEAAAVLGATVEPAGLVYDAGRSPSDKQTQKLEDEMNKFSEQTFVFIERGYQARDDARMLLLAVFALVITIGASGVATGLALADAQKDLATLGSVGAPPGVRRRLSAFQSGVIAFLGTALGLAAGVLAGVMVRRGQKSAVWDAMPEGAQRGLPAPETVIPWTELGLALVLLPLLAALLAAVLTRSRSVVRGRTA
ncbi:FtsX-like permease family protein [Embleya sp. NBC_00896]|uniref:FtsX-like permease family protein n=1 Tax=Embleya sp. NBC_00896 TaxID=2975961 RepID=UPI003863338C|nr:FtsX-like permease family protein [Embleya sp. NBC_00896]